eukprot:5115056-Prymnesium_polylepis.1
MDRAGSERLTKYARLRGASDKVVPLARLVKPRGHRHAHLARQVGRAREALAARRHARIVAHEQVDARHRVRHAVDDGVAAARELVARLLDAPVVHQRVEHRHDVVHPERLAADEPAVVDKLVHLLRVGALLLGDELDARVLQMLDELVVEVLPRVEGAARDLLARLEVVEDVHLLVFRRVPLDGPHELARLERLEHLGELRLLHARRLAQVPRRDARRPGALHLLIHQPVLDGEAVKLGGDLIALHAEEDLVVDAGARHQLPPLDEVVQRLQDHLLWQAAERLLQLVLRHALRARRADAKDGVGRALRRVARRGARGRRLARLLGRWGRHSLRALEIAAWRTQSPRGWRLDSVRSQWRGRQPTRALEMLGLPLLALGLPLATAFTLRGPPSRPAADRRHEAPRAQAFPDLDKGAG